MSSPGATDSFKLELLLFSKLSYFFVDVAGEKIDKYAKNDLGYAHEYKYND